MIAPFLPESRGLVRELKKKVDYVIIDRMNYHHSDWVYRKHKIEWARREEFFLREEKEIRRLLEKEGIPCRLLF